MLKKNASQKNNKVLINSQKSIGKEWLEGWRKLFWRSDYEMLAESSWTLKIKYKILNSKLVIRSYRKMGENMGYCESFNF